MTPQYTVYGMQYRRMRYNTRCVGNPNNCLQVRAGGPGLLRRQHMPIQYNARPCRQGKSMQNNTCQYNTMQCHAVRYNTL